ncbi:hypothetical protein [Prosthecobacter vanneervenii]|uniref:Uncharacterized protein n=1 Tax=Prosthecobacter vanneervenii TaxID=48466 RepID=A0A7W7Y862_9BACT|nr:hypothetical protein [Prosthecobacter vanneervenii]MBB5031359.1 hypothetical protein [Prosthecobacter vanneervenii]
MCADKAKDAWIAEHLCDSYSWYPERIGRKHLLFARPASETLLGMAVDPAPRLPNWTCLPGKTPSQSFFEHLRPCISQDASYAYFTFPDGAWIELHGHHPLTPEMWSPLLLRFFQEIPVEQGGPQMLAVLIRNKRGAIIFSVFDEFEIAFYGPDDLWTEIEAALYRSL